MPVDHRTSYDNGILIVVLPAEHHENPSVFISNTFHTWQMSQLQDGNASLQANRIIWGASTHSKLLGDGEGDKEQWKTPDGCIRCCVQGKDSGLEAHFTALVLEVSVSQSQANVRRKAAKWLLPYRAKSVLIVNYFVNNIKSVTKISVELWRRRRLRGSIPADVRDHCPVADSKVYWPTDSRPGHGRDPSIAYYQPKIRIYFTASREYQSPEWSRVRPDHPATFTS
jgi:hypothetical protein